MKVSVSLPEDEVRFLDEYAREQGYESRSAVMLRAVRLLRAEGLGAAYADAWTEWVSSDEAEVWEAAAGDGLASA